MHTEKVHRLELHYLFVMFQKLSAILQLVDVFLFVLEAMSTYLYFSAFSTTLDGVLEFHCSAIIWLEKNIDFNL